MKTKLLGIFLAFLVCFLIAAPVFAQVQGELEKVGEGIYGGSVPGEADLPTTIGNIINVVLGFLGVILIVIIIYAGFLYMTAGGNEDQVKKAKSWMINAIIGLVIILLAYAITSFVISRLLEATGVDTL